MAGGRGHEGYFHWAPTGEPGAVNTRENVGNYPWSIRRESYGGDGMGRLTAMSVNPIREEKALRAADGLQGTASAKQMGEELKNLLDSGKPFEGITGPMEGGYRGTRDIYEIETQMLVETLGLEGDTKNIDFGDYATSPLKGERKAVEGFAGQGTLPAAGKLGGFDIDLTQSHNSFKNFLETPVAKGGLGLRKGYIDDYNVHSMEITRATARIKDASKLMTAIDTKGLSQDQLQITWENKLEQLVTDWNLNLREYYTNLNKQYNDATQGWRALRDSLPGLSGFAQDQGIPSDAKQRTQEEKDMMKSLATLREMTHRMLLDEVLRGIGGTANSQHLWTAPLGDNLGMTVFWPTFENIPLETESGRLTGGVGAPTFNPQATTFPIPQIGWSRNNVFLLPVPNGDLPSAYALFMEGKGALDPNMKLDILSENIIAASNESVLTFARLGTLGMNMIVAATHRIRPGLKIKLLETRQLRPTEMAQQLYEQIVDYYGTGKAKKEIQNWYQELMEESNELTRTWYKNMPENTEGTATLSSEYVIGDDKGNPRKHYLGVFSHPKLDTWEGVGYGAKDAIGYNFSISPFITSRRAGTSLFGSKKGDKGGYF